MYVKSTRPSAKREVQKKRSAKRYVQKFRSAQRDDRTLRSAKRDDQIAQPRRAQTCELRAKCAMRMCPRSGQIFFFIIINIYEQIKFAHVEKVVKTYLGTLEWEVLPHPPYSPGIAPSDHHLFFL